MKSNNKTSQTPVGSSSEPESDKIAFALKAVFGGISQAVQQALDSPFIHDARASMRLTAMAECCERGVEAIRTGSSTATIRGEMIYFSENLESDLQNSRFDAANFRSRLEAARDALARGDKDPLGEAAGYFRAAASTVPTTAEINPAESATP